MCHHMNAGVQAEGIDVGRQRLFEIVAEALALQVVKSRPRAKSSMADRRMTILILFSLGESASRLPKG